MLALNSWRLRLWFALLAGVGLVGAHSLTYLLAESHSHDRAQLLAKTGHGSWSSVELTTLAVVPLLLFFFLRSFVHQSPEGGSSYPRSVLNLGCLQAAGFFLVESFERFTVGGDLSSVLGDRVIWLGLAIQLVVAALACLALLLVASVARMFRARRMPAAKGAEPQPLSSEVVGNLAPDISPGAWSLRGPPPLPV